jgi:hypothetical protein
MRMSRNTTSGASRSAASSAAGAVSRDRDDLQFGPCLGERSLQAHREQRLVLGDQRARFHPSGKRSATETPPPGASATCTDASAP